MWGPPGFLGLGVCRGVLDLTREKPACVELGSELDCASGGHGLAVS